MERSKVIEHLQQLKCDYTNYWEETHDEITDALDNAIADVKLVSQLSDYDLVKPIAEVKDIDYEGTYIKLSDLQDYIYEVENGRTK